MKSLPKTLGYAALLNWVSPLNRLITAIVLGSALFGVLTMQTGSQFAWLTHAIFYGLPVAILFLWRSENGQIIAVWSSIFVVLQALATPLVVDIDLKRLPANLDLTVNVTGKLHGISGPLSITTDDQAFRVTRNIDYSDEQTYRIFAIGGSTTEQIYLDDRQTWTHLLQVHLDSQRNETVEVINTGVSGLRARHHLATLKHILPFAPDAVVFLVGVNDWNSHITTELDGFAELRRFRRFFTRNFSIPNTFLGFAINAVQRQLGLLSEQQTTGTHDDDGARYTSVQGSLNKPDVRRLSIEQVDSAYVESLSEIAAICGKNRIECMFVTQPTGYKPEASDQFRQSFWMTPPNRHYTLEFDALVAISQTYNGYIKEFSKNHGLHICDAAKEIPASFEAFFDDCHFNISGARKMADILVSCFQENGL